MRRGRADEVTEEDVRLLLHLISCGKQVMNYRLCSFCIRRWWCLIICFAGAAAVTEAARVVKRTRVRAVVMKLATVMTAPAAAAQLVTSSSPAYVATFKEMQRYLVVVYAWCMAPNLSPEPAAGTSQ